LPPSVSLTVVGSINLDLVARCERLPQPGETITDASFDRFPGGKGANQAVAASRLGAYVRMVGAVGEDPFADEALKGIEEARIDHDLAHATEPTGVALIYVDASGETEIVVAPGANAAVTTSGPIENLLCQLEIPAKTVAAAARSTTGFFALNAAPSKPEAPRLTALTLGAEGAVLLEDGEEVARAAPPRVDAVDGTAAGDAFTACMVVSLLEGRDREEALRRSCAAGAIAASRRGAQPSLPTAAEIDDILSR
jgi:ribokinase